MGLGWHVVLQSDLPGMTPAAIDGKALIFRQRDLDGIARTLGLEAFTHFVSVDPSALADYLRQQGVEPDADALPEEEWFDPSEGLRTVRGLLAHLRIAPDAVLDSFRIVRDLQAIEQVLAAAEAAHVLFHLASDRPTLA